MMKKKLSPSTVADTAEESRAAKCVKKESATKAEAVEALRKEVAKAVGVASIAVLGNKKEGKKNNNEGEEPAKKSPKMGAETPKKKASSTTTRLSTKGKQSSDGSSPPKAISAPTQNNVTASGSPSSDDDKQKKKKSSPIKNSDNKQKNLVVYLEELLYELSCLDLVQSENLFPFETTHLRRLVNREVASVRNQISQDSKNSQSLHLSTAPSPNVRRLTVFPEELLAPSDSYAGNIVDNLVDGGYGDISLGSRVPWRRNLVSSANNVPSPPLLNPFGNNARDLFGCGPASARVFARNHKIYIPEHPSYNFIGRILGPRGNSVRRLESLTGCKILIRGKGSVKDPAREAKLRNTTGWEHLKEKLHVSITAEDGNEHICDIKLHRAAAFIQRLLTPSFDDYKRQQLVQLAIINGTYRA